MDSNNWLGTLCIEVSPIPNIIIILGASGDLAQRKLLPALFGLSRRKLFHPESKIIGCARTPLDDESFRAAQVETLRSHFPEAAAGEINEFLSRVSYLSGGYDQNELYLKLSKKLSELEDGQEPRPNRTFYLATPASLYPIIIPKLSDNRLTEENYDGVPWRHVILEKPFGSDSLSAEQLDRLLHESLSERQIYRIDHYLGKETVQNILMLRFANIIFEPIWNSHYIESVQITAAEALGVENRAGYYEKAGLLRDMFQNHMLEMLSLVAMEPPAAFEADAIRDEKLKLIKAIRPLPIKQLDKYLVRGQYVAGNGMKGYREEADVDPKSTTETYVAAKFMIDNWRWRGVPFYLRSGKRLGRKLSEIAITFRRVPHSIFDRLRPEDLSADQLVLNVQPQEGMTLKIQAKQPGPKLCMGQLSLDFKYSQIFGGEIPDAYERLLLDCMLGDQTLFIRSDIIAASWRLFTPVLEAWTKFKADDSTCPCRIHYYPAGSSGPAEAEKLLDGHEWREI